MRPVSLLALLLALPAAAAEALPPGWHLVDPSGAYQASPGEGRCGPGRSLTLRSLRAGGGHATVAQRFQATPFLGRRIRVSALVRTHQVRGWAGLWMRVDGEEPGRSLAFDDMQDRPLRGTLACQALEVVLDVPDVARTISAGLLLSGEGEVELSAVRFDPVPDTVASTDLLKKGLALRAPAPPVTEPPADPATALGSLRSGRPGLAGLFGGRPLAWYSATQLREPGLALDRRADGTWASASGDDHAELDGATVRARLWGQRGELRVSHPSAEVLLVQGTWEGRPLAVAVGPLQLRVAWGGLRAAFVRSQARFTEPGCVRYQVHELVGRVSDDATSGYVAEGSGGDGDAERELCGELAAAAARPLQAAVLLLGAARRLEGAPPVSAASARGLDWPLGLQPIPRQDALDLGYVSLPQERPVLRSDGPATPPTPVQVR